MSHQAFREIRAGNFLAELGNDTYLVGGDFIPGLRRTMAVYCQRAQARMESGEITLDELFEIGRTLWAGLVMECSFAPEPEMRALARAELENPERLAMEERTLSIARRLAKRHHGVEL